MKQILLVGMLIVLSPAALAATWLPVGRDKSDGECYYLNVDRLGANSYLPPTHEAVAWIKTTKPGATISLRELIHFSCASGQYRLVRRYTVAGEDRLYRRSIGSPGDRTAQPGTTAAELLDNVCAQVEHIAKARRNEDVSSAPAPTRQYAECQEK